MLCTEPEALAVPEPGQQLRRIRERLGLKYRDVEEASATIATARNNDQFQVGLSRLADIENRGTVPSIYRIYSLCAIYRLEFRMVLAWYGVDLSGLGGDTASVQLKTTNVLNNHAIENPSVYIPTTKQEMSDAARTSYLTGQLIRWGHVPLALLEGVNPQQQRYAFIGLNDWFMFPLLRPGSFVQVDQGKRKVSSSGWTSEWDRPIYLLEHHEGYRCAWCSIQGDMLVAQPHPASHSAAEMYRLPDGVEVIGQVTALATRLYPGTRPRTHFSTSQE